MSKDSTTTSTASLIMTTNNNNTIDKILYCELGDNNVWNKFTNMLSRGTNENITYPFLYSICSVTFIHSETDYTYCTIKAYLVINSISLQTNQSYWDFLSTWLVDNLFSIQNGYRNPLISRNWVTDNQEFFVENGDIVCISRKYVLSVLHSVTPIINIENLCNLFADCITEESDSDVTALVIEESKNNIRYPFAKWCCSAKKDGILSPRRLMNISKLHIIHPNNTQTYHTFGLERNTHYSVMLKNLNCFLWICSAVGLTVYEYPSSMECCKSRNLCVVNSDTNNTIPFKQIYDSMKQMKSLGALRNRNDVWLVSYGFSGRAKEYIGGPPCLTKGIGGRFGGNNILVKLALPILEMLTDKLLTYFKQRVCIDEIRNALFAERIGENFDLAICKFNLFEGFDFAITSGFGGNILTPHCDVMNDWRPGHNYCSVTKSIIFDEEIQQHVQVVLIAYTRKDIGDYLYGAGVFLSS